VALVTTRDAELYCFRSTDYAGARRTATDSLRLVATEEKPQTAVFSVWLTEDKSPRIPLLNLCSIRAETFRQLGPRSECSSLSNKVKPGRHCPMRLEPEEDPIIGNLPPSADSIPASTWGPRLSTISFHPPLTLATIRSIQGLRLTVAERSSRRSLTAYAPSAQSAKICGSSSLPADSVPFPGAGIVECWPAATAWQTRRKGVFQTVRDLTIGIGE